MSFGFGFALPAYPLRGGGGNNPFNQDGATLDLSFIGTAGNLSGADTYTLNTDFITPEYQVAAQYAVWENGVGLAQKTFAQIVTFTRASTATYFNSAGTLTSAAVDEARFDYNPSTLVPLGFLIEESRTNSIRNNTMQGAVAGTPGTLPNDWFASTALTGLTFSVVGTGLESGITYIDVRINGTPSAAGNYDFAFVANTQVSALTGQTWTESLYYRVAAGTSSGLSTANIRFNEYTSGNVFISGQTSANLLLPTTAALSSQRVSATATLNGGATTAAVQPLLRLGLSGAAIDITLRIGLPQLELGAFATSVIPTTTTALTRSADVASVNTLAPWFNASEGTLFVQAQDMSDAAHATSEPRAASINDGTANNTINIVRIPASAQARARVVTGGTPVFNTLTTAWPLATQAKIGLAYKANDFAACLGGGAVATSASGAIPTVSALTIGNITTGGSNSWVGWIQRITYYPRRLSNADLQTITT